MGLRTADILDGLERFSKCALPQEVRSMVAECTERYGKVKLILRNDRFYIECPTDSAAFDALLHDPQARHALLEPIRGLGQMAVHTSSSAYPSRSRSGVCSRIDRAQCLLAEQSSRKSREVNPGK